VRRGEMEMKDDHAAVRKKKGGDPPALRRSSLRGKGGLPLREGQQSCASDRRVKKTEGGGTLHPVERDCAEGAPDLCGHIRGPANQHFWRKKKKPSRQKTGPKEIMLPERNKLPGQKKIR